MYDVARLNGLSDAVDHLVRNRSTLDEGTVDCQIALGRQARRAPTNAKPDGTRICVWLDDEVVFKLLAGAVVFNVDPPVHLGRANSRKRGDTCPPFGRIAPKQIVNVSR
jgi:hypothetical protein